MSCPMKTKQIKIFIFVILLFIQAGCTFGGKKSSQVVTSEGVLPPDTKMVGFNINIGPVGNAGANTGQTFVFNISCPNVYQIAGLPAGSSSVGGTWRATVTVVSDGSPTTQLNLPQFANGHIISCIAVLDSMSHLDGTNTVYTSDYQKLTLILDPDQSHTATGGLSAPDNTALSLTTVPNLGMILPNNYTALYYYSKAGTPTDSFYITGAFARGTHGAKTDPGSVLTCGPLEVNKDCYRNYVIGFVYSKSVTEAQNYLKNPAVSAAFQISEDPALPPPENPELVLVQYPSDSEVGKFRYRMYGRAFLENSSTSTAGDPTAINDYFSPTPNSPITDASVQDAGGLFDTNANEMITNASTDFIRKFIFQFYYNIIPPSTTVDQFKNIVKNANSCKIFVIADSTNKWYNNHVTVADPANSNVNLQTVPNTHVSGTPTPYIWDTAHPASDFPNISQIPDAPGAATLGIQNLNALMTVPSDGTNGVYDCTDLKDYYGKESTPTGVAANYTAAPGTVDTADSNKAKILISNLILNKNDKLPEGAEASTPMKNQFFNWGIDDPDNAPEAALSQTQSATYYPQLNKFKLLFIYRNQRSSTVAKKKGFSFMNAAADTTIVRNAYTYVVVNPMTSDGDGGIAPGGGSSADLQLLDEGIETYTITGSPIYVAHNQCKKITIQAWDNDTGTISVPPNPTNNATISFSSNDLNVSFYSSLSDCNNSTGSILSIALNSGKADVFIKNTVKFIQ